MKMIQLSLLPFRAVEQNSSRSRFDPRLLANADAKADYDLDAVSFAPDDVKNIKQALEDLGIKNTNDEDLTYYNSAIPPDLIKKLQTGADRDRRLARELSKNKSSTSFHSGASARWMSFISPAHIKALNVNGEIPEKIAEKMVAAHEVAHKFLHKNDNEHFDGFVGELLADYVSLKLVAPEYILSARLLDGSYPIFDGIIKDSISDVLKPFALDHYDRDLFSLIEMTFNPQPLETGGVLSAEKTRNFANLMTVLEDFIAGKLKNQSGAPKGARDLFNRISQKFAEKLRARALEEAKKLKLI